ncbi:M48 family metallopeptidase [Prosthecomicrobium sp. N25]|uniref:M48 family metallopeptidase n=1 Tax=Prosthecomicrobium sp. N25 TaxID=3129254 RepID=UPI003076DF41
MRIEGPALYYDGRSSRGSAVRFVLDLAGVTILSAEGGAIAAWPLGSVRRADSGPGLLRLASTAAEDARLEISDADALRDVGPALRALPDRDGTSWAGVAKVGAWFAAAVASLVGLVWIGIPAAADKLAPLVPVPVEQKLGGSVKPQILAALNRGQAPRLCAAPAGKAALERLTAPLVAAARAPMPITIEVVDVPVPNAFALPGGHVLVMRGLIDRMQGPDELAGVLAHEFGHVVHRDAMRGVLKSAGLSILVGVVVGDFTGSTIAVAVGRTLIDASYSRGAETMADDFAVDLMGRVGRDGGALGTALERITADGPKLDGALSWLSTHPDTAARAEALRKAGAGRAKGPALLDAAGWASLRAICS